MSDAAPIIVSALFGPSDQARLDRLRRAHFPPERNRLPAHLTMFHHLPPSIEPELLHRLKIIARGHGPMAATLDAPYSLKRGVALRVRSPALLAIREELAEAFFDCLTPEDRAAWHPHVTIQNKAAPQAARELLQRLKDEFVPRLLMIEGLATWRYREGLWEPIRAIRFRG